MTGVKVHSHLLSEYNIYSHTYLYQKHLIIRKWENPDFILYVVGNPDQSHNLMGSKLEQDQYWGKTSLFSGRSK